MLIANWFSFVSGTLSRADRQQQRAREEIGLALQAAASDDGEYVSPMVGRRAIGLRRQQLLRAARTNEALEPEQSEAPAPLLATFAMDTPQRHDRYQNGQPLMMAETTLNPTVCEADVVTATRTSSLR